MLQKILFLCFGIAALACQTPEQSTVSGPKPTQLEGQYRSRTGVMSSISCYCFQAGELVDERGEKTYLCWEGEEEAPRSCENIRVWGEYTSKTREEDPNSPCPAGEMRYFSVQKYECH